MPPDQTFLQELRELWGRNPVAAVLTARLDYGRIPSDVGAIARGMNSSFREDQAINDSVNSAMGAMGLFGGGGGGFTMRIGSLKHFLRRPLASAPRRRPRLAHGASRTPSAAWQPRRARPHAARRELQPAALPAR